MINEILFLVVELKHVDVWVQVLFIEILKLLMINKLKFVVVDID